MAQTEFVEWKDWKPGVLSERQTSAMIDGGAVQSTAGAVHQSAVGASSFDLSVTGQVYRLKRGSVKPFGPGYLAYLKKQDLVELLPDGTDGVVLQRRTTYLLPLRECLADRALLWGGEFHGLATAKSSIGRLDVLARLVVDGASMYEGFTSADLRGSDGQMFLEVTPMTFPIKVHLGNSLSQLRLFKGRPEKAEIKDEFVSRRVLSDSHDKSLSVDLRPVALDGGAIANAFCTKKDLDQDVAPVDLASKNENGADPYRYWEALSVGHADRFALEPGRFYILRSKELITVPADVAVYCRASDEAVGEMRIHYAGFVHPRFGLDRKDGGCGTPLIFEVRGHDIPVSLGHGEKMAKLIFYKMSEPSTKGDMSDYGSQTLKLSTYFMDWRGDKR